VNHSDFSFPSSVKGNVLREECGSPGDPLDAEGNLTYELRSVSPWESTDLVGKTGNHRLAEVRLKSPPLASGVDEEASENRLRPSFRKELNYKPQMTSEEGGLLLNWRFIKRNIALPRHADNRKACRPKLTLRPMRPWFAQAATTDFFDKVVFPISDGFHCMCGA